jgi:hypothetical protein
MYRFIQYVVRTITGEKIHNGHIQRIELVGQLIGRTIIDTVPNHRHNSIIGW